MGDDPSDRQLERRFIERCGEDLLAIETALVASAPGEGIGPIVHRMAGAAGMFGHEALGDLAAELDDMIAGGEVPPPAKLRELAAALRRALAGDGAAGGRTGRSY